MSIKLHFLGADKPLTKSFSLSSKGDIEKSPYPFVKHFTSYEEIISSTEEFYSAISKHATKGHCLLKGNLDRPLVNESRAGHTQASAPTEWMILDVDGLDIEPVELLKLIEHEDIAYILQYSASSGIIRDMDIDNIPPCLNRYHMFFMLDKPYLPAQLKEILKSWNLNTPEISNHITLTASKVALNWPLDISVCQNDKLIYIAPPICGKGITDTLADVRINKTDGHEN